VTVLQVKLGGEQVKLGDKLKRRVRGEGWRGPWLVLGRNVEEPPGKNRKKAWIQTNNAVVCALKEGQSNVTKRGANKLGRLAHKNEHKRACAGDLTLGGGSLIGVVPVALTFL